MTQQAEQQMIKNAEEGKHLVARGILSFNLHRLRDAMNILFLTSYWHGHSYISNNKNSKLPKLRIRDFEYRSTGRLRRFLYANNSIKITNSIPFQKLRVISSSIVTSCFQIFSSFVSSIFAQIDPSIMKENKAIMKDFLLLSSPDFEISGERKIATAVRMRSTYGCLIPPKPSSENS